MTVVVPYLPAGGVDIVTRLVTTPMAEFLGQSIVVENNSPEAARISAWRQWYARAQWLFAADGLEHADHQQGAVPKLSFDPATDLIPVGRIGEAPLVVVVNAKSPYKSLAELIAAGKAKPGVLSHGTAGVGSSGHMASALLEKAGQFKAFIFPAKQGGSTAVTDLLGGRLDFMAINPLEVAGHVNSGNLRALAVLNKNGSRLLPQVPTARSWAWMCKATVWWGLVAPKGTPEAVIQTLNAALNKALTTPAVTQTLADMGATPWEEHRPSSAASSRPKPGNSATSSEPPIFARTDAGEGRPAQQLPEHLHRRVTAPAAC